MPPRKLANMTTEDREKGVENLSPAWARDYIRQLEELTRTLHRQLTEARDQLAKAQAQGAADLAGVTEIADHARAELRQRDGEPVPAAPRLDLDPAAAGIAWRALDAMGNASLSERDDAIISYVSSYFGAQLPPRPEAAGHDGPDDDGEEWDPGQHGQPVAPPPVPGPEVLPAPSGEYVTMRVLDGRAGMEPLADLPEGAEIRVTDFYQVRYDSHETTGGMRLLVIEGDDKIVICPVSPTTVLVARGGVG